MQAVPGSAAPESKVLRQVEEEFNRLSGNESLIKTAIQILDAWLTVSTYAQQRDAILEHAAQGQFPLLLDSFYQLLPFGTGGRRGRVGYGPNRINQITVAMSVQGHCNYLRQNYSQAGSPRIAIAFDTRIFSDIAKTYAFLRQPSALLGLTSRELARIACEIYADNGFEVFVAGLHGEGSYVSTPELSFAIRHLGAVAGMNVSASHNHPDDNGFKFFNEHGAQDIPPTDQIMASYMGEVQEIKRRSFIAAVSEGRIRPFPEEMHRSYIDLNLGLRSQTEREFTVVYTPLCGTGDLSTGDVLRAAGFDVRLYEPHATYDGTFSSVPFRLPNPEVPEAASPALRFADEVGAELVLSTDPDADRLGVFARDSKGKWRYLNGNEIASILAYYLALDTDLGPRRRGFMVKTLVTTRMLERIAEKSGCAIVPDLLVGFKYIANVLLSLEREGRFGNVEAQPSDLVLAGEESHGVLLTSEIRDKDAAGGALILCELAAQLRARGRHLPEYLDALSLECGNCQNASRSIVMRGIRGSTLLAQMMKSLREDPPPALGGLRVERRRDFLSEEHGPLRSETERLSRNLLAYDLKSALVVVRPSGTEPKAKIYVDVDGETLNRLQARKFAETLAAQVVEECIRRIGFRLSSSASLLPDYVDVDLKHRFGTSFRDELTAEAETIGGMSGNEQLAWLRARLAPYGSGADPLESAAPAVSDLLREVAEASSATLKPALFALSRIVQEIPPRVEWVR
ncbi:MAG TPA: phospho-sugar mutase [Bryobacteraceae bacterium]